MSYHVLTKNSLNKYIKNNEILKNFFNDKHLAISEIGDGNLNLIFLVESTFNKAIIKQSLPYLRCVGKDFPLCKERINYEIAALKEFYKQTPNHIPNVYHADQEM